MNWDELGRGGLTISAPLILKFCPISYVERKRASRCQGQELDQGAGFSFSGWPAITQICPK